MPPVTGEPQLGGEEAADVSNHEKGRPPDEIYEDDRLDTSSRQFPSASMSKSTKISAEDSEPLKPFVPWKGKRKLESEEVHLHFPDGFQSEDVESASALGLSCSDITDPHTDSKHRDYLPQITFVDLSRFSADSLAETQALDRMEMGEKYPIWQPGKSEHSFQAFLVHGTWASIENVRKISSSLWVNKLQCEHIADHFKVIGDVLTKLGLGKDFVSGQALEGGSVIQINLTFDETHFDHIAQTFDETHFNHIAGTLEKHFDDIAETFEKHLDDIDEGFQKCIHELPAMDGFGKESLSRKSKISKGYSPLGMSMNERIEAQSGYRVQHRLDEFLCLLFGVLKHGEDLVFFHSGLEGANTGVVSRTGMSGEMFVQIHELLYHLLDYYACLEHYEGTEFASSYLPRHDVCGAELILYYSNWNFLQRYASLFVFDNFLNIEMATRIAKMLKGPNCALKKLFIKSLPGVKIDQVELQKGRLMLFAALSKHVSLTSLTVRGLNGEEVHGLCKSLLVNRVLEKLVISIDGPLANNDAMDLSAMVKENPSLKSFTLEFHDVSLEGVYYLGAILAKISLDHIHLKLRGLRGFIKYLLGLLMACIEKKVFILSIEEHPSYFKIRRSVDLSTGKSDSENQILRINKTLHHSSIKFQNLDPDVVCEILGSLKKNKTLQFLELEVGLPRDGGKLGDNCEVVACLEALLAENSRLTELKVQFHVWDKCFIKHLLRPLMAEKDGEPHVNISLRQLHIVNYQDSAMISDAKFSPDEVIESVARMLRTNKTLNHFSMINACLRTCDICAIVDSLKINKTLQVLHLEERKVFDDPDVKLAFIDLLVNYNFTLSMMRISMHGLGDDTPWRDQVIQLVMEGQLRFDIKMALRELRSLIRTTSDSPIVRSVHDLEQVVGTLQLEKGEGSTEEVCGPFEKASDKHKSKDERPRVFLSYSKEMRDFARLLCEKLKSSNYNVVDQDSINFVEVVDQCQLAIVVLSDMYVNSKPSMSELCTIVRSKKTNNPTLKVYPLFYKLTLHDLQNAYVPVSTFGGEGSSSDIALEREALKFLLEGKIEVSKKANDLVENLSQGKIDVGKFCEEFNELQRSSWPCNGLEFETHGIYEEAYLHAILEEIFHYMPEVKEYSNDQMLGYQGKLEMESKLSLRQMKSLLESLPMSNFYLLRRFNMAQSLQEKYIQYSSFEEMCLYLSRDQKHEYSKGRIAAALFPTTFLYHFKVHMFQNSNSENFRRMLKAVGVLVAQKMHKECNQNGVQTFFDFVDFGAPLDPSRTKFAMCQNFPAKTLDGSKQLVIVQDELTGAYYYQCNEALDLENPTIDATIGVVGVQVTFEEIHVDNIHEDGSSYSGVLGDFSYEFDSDKNKQCATKAFGDLEGARFLSKNSGIKCSPLLIIALASAIQRKGLTLTWRNGKGHMEFYPKLAHKLKVEVEASACQIQYTSNINQLGLEIEWGTGSNSSPHNQTFQRGTNEIVNQQVFGSNVDRSVGTSNFSDDGTVNVPSAMNMQNDIALYNAASQNKIPHSIGMQIAGNGFNYSYETCDPETRQVRDEVFQDIRRQRYSSKGGFHRIPTLDNEYPDLENQLLSCQLHQDYNHNYLVVYNVSKARHISIYKAIEQNEVVPKFELTWISDIPIDGGKKQIKEIFETGLKGRELIVQRNSSNFTQLKDPLKLVEKIVPGYQESLLKFTSRFPRNAITTSMSPIPVPNLVGKLKSKNEWVHIIGPQAKYEASYKYWWKATSMEAIVYSRTRYTSGTLLTTETKLPFDGIGHIGYCSVEEGRKGLKHKCGSVVSRGKFSRPPGSLLDNKVLWGGLEIVLENSSLQ